MAEHRHDFLHVMRHQRERRRFLPATEPIEVLQEMLAGDRVETRAGFVENEDPWLGHQRAADDHALAFTLRKKHPRPLGEVFAFDLFEDAQSADAVRLSDASPEIDHRVFAAHDRVERRLGPGHHLPHRRTDQANLFA